MEVVDVLDDQGLEAATDARSYPRIRARRSLATPVLVFVAVIVVLSAFSAAYIVGQSRALRAEFDLLTEVYVPFGVRLSEAQAGSVKLGARIEALSQGGPRAMAALDDRALVIFAEALERREALVEEVGIPVERAIGQLQAGEESEKLKRLLTLASQVEQLEQAVHVDAGRPVIEVMADSRRQHEINNRFRSLQATTSTLVLEQQQRVIGYTRQTERLIVVTTAVSGVLSLLVAVVVALTLRPLQRLSEGVRELGQGARGQRVALKGSDPTLDDEVSRLAREFNLMADALEEREKRLVSSERLAAVGQLVAQMTHEIRNPLSSVALNFELLEDELPTASPEATKLVHAIGRELERLSSITETYLDFVRRPQPTLVATDLGEELDDLVEFVRPEFQQAAVELSARRETEACWAEVDVGQLRRVLMNLLRNAREATMARLREEPAPPGAVAVVIRRAADRVEFDVHDNGAGIAGGEAARGQIFDAFFTQKAKGTGLGLAVVAQVLDAHAGTVRVLQSGAQGTVFRVSLPACDPSGASVSSGDAS